MDQEFAKDASEPGRPERIKRLQTEKFSRYFLILILIIISVSFFNMIKIFALPIFLAAVFTGLFYPLYERFVKIIHNKGVSSILCCFVLLLGLLIPVYIVINLVTKEAIQFYHTAQTEISTIVEQGDEGLLGRIKQDKLFKAFKLDQVNWPNLIQEGGKTFGNLAATIINKTSKGTFQVMTNLFIMLFTMFYFFKDGDRLIDRIKYLSPIRDLYEEAMIFRFMSVSRATVKGTLMIGVTQGILGGLTLWLFDIGSPVLWAVVMFFLSIIPLVGAWLILYPAALIQILMGNIWQGVGIFLISAVIISNVDNLMRPRLVGRDAGMHDLMIFFSTLGGISVFGIMGFIVGPVIAVLFLTVLDIYSIEFKAHLDLAKGSDAPGKFGNLIG